MSIAASDTPAVPEGPEGFAFYRPEPSQLEGDHGQVIWRRKLEGEAALASARVNELVLYRSRDVRGNPIAVSGIIALPSKDPPKGGYRVISWAHGTVGSADVAAPSLDAIGAPAHIYNKYPHALLNTFLEKGWAVLMTDYEGLGTEGPHPYMLGKSEARGILDIVLAARQLYPGEISNRLAIVGHSQGGQAALFGAHHAPDWTPDLDLRGVAALAPASGVKVLVAASSVLPTTDAEGGFAFTALFITGAIGGNPDIKAQEILGPKAYALWGEVEQKSRAQLSEPDSWGKLRGTELLNPLPSPAKKALFDQFELMHPALRILVPIRISQAVHDQRVKVEFTRELQGQLTTLNGPSSVLYKEYDTVSPTEEAEKLGFHFGLLDTDRQNLTAWLEDRLSDSPT